VQRKASLARIRALPTTMGTMRGPRTEKGRERKGKSGCVASRMWRHEPLIESERSIAPPQRMKIVPFGWSHGAGLLHSGNVFWASGNHGPCSDCDTWMVDPRPAPSTRAASEGPMCSYRDRPSSPVESEASQVVAVHAGSEVLHARPPAHCGYFVQFAPPFTGPLPPPMWNIANEPSFSATGACN
jgi:hypothetical protein